LGLHRCGKKGLRPNSLTPFVGDANIETPEFKAFLVNVEPSNGPATS
jgi:formate dehydrogenase major subunit